MEEIHMPDIEPTSELPKGPAGKSTDPSGTEGQEENLSQEEGESTQTKPEPVTAEEIDKRADAQNVNFPDKKEEIEKMRAFSKAAIDPNISPDDIVSQAEQLEMSDTTLEEVLRSGLLLDDARVQQIMTKAERLKKEGEPSTTQEQVVTQAASDVEDKMRQAAQTLQDGGSVNEDELNKLMEDAKMSQRTLESHIEEPNLGGDEFSKRRLRKIAAGLGIWTFILFIWVYKSIGNVGQNAGRR